MYSALIHRKVNKLVDLTINALVVGQFVRKSSLKEKKKRFEITGN